MAAYGEHHLLIEKAVSDGRTFTEIKPLDETGRISELARIMNGEPITPLALENARELLTRVQAETRVSRPFEKAEKGRPLEQTAVLL